MLVLTRKSGEWIDIGDEISVCVIEVTGEKCRLGVSAPRDVPVHRREISERIANGAKVADRAEAA